MEKASAMVTRQRECWQLKLESIMFSPLSSQYQPRSSLPVLQPPCWTVTAGVQVPYLLEHLHLT